MGFNRPLSVLAALVFVGAAEISFAFQLDQAPAAGPAGTAPAQAQTRALPSQLATLPARRSLDVAYSASQRVQARWQHAALPSIQPHDAASQVATWQPIGPNQVLTSRYGKVTGRITSIAIDPWDKSGNTVYAGTTGGGVWKSTNAAAARDQVLFSSLTDDLPAFSSGATASLSIGALTVQPGGTGVVLAGTGDPNNSIDSYYGSGLLRSNDNGTTWTLITQSSDGTYGPYRNFSFMGKAFSGFAWSTVAPNLVVAALSDSAEGTVVNAAIAGTSVQGLYYSNDAGATWQMASVQDSVGQWIQRSDNSFINWAGNAATAVVWNPVRKKFYAAIRYHGYYESPDGKTWTRLASQPGLLLNKSNCPTTFNAPGAQTCGMFRGALSVQPFTGDLFAFSVDRANKDVGLWQDVCNLKSGACTSSTVSFSKQIPTTSLETQDGKQSILLGNYNLWLQAVPSSADTLLYAGTTDIFRCSMAAGCTWRNATNSVSCAAARVSPFQHAVDYVPGLATQPFTGLMFFGNDGGLWRTTNGINQLSPACSPEDAASFDNLNAGIGSLAEVASFAQDPTDENVVLAGLGANGTAAQSQAGQTTWPQAMDGYGATTAIDPVQPQYWSTTSASGVAIERCSVGAACTPADFSPLIDEATVGGDGNSMVAPAAFALDSTDPSQILVGTCRVWRGPANGSSWSASNAISGSLDKLAAPVCSGNAVIRSLASIAAPDGGEYIYAGMAGLLDGGATVPGHLYRASWNGAASAWTDISTSRVSNASQPFNQGKFAISSIVPDAHDASGQTVYVSIAGFSGNAISSSLVYQSKDAGAHWTNMNSNLPWAPANSLVVDPEDANTVYVALDTGVYVTEQISDCANPLINCWSVFGTGLPNSPVTQLRLQGGAIPMLRASTYGRGIWQIPLPRMQPTTTTAEVVPTAVTFPDQPVQTTSTNKTVVVTNSGTLPLDITKIEITGDFTQTNTCATPVPVQGSCAIDVATTPSRIGTTSGTLTLSANVPGGQLTVPLSGNGIKGADILLMPSALDFGTLLTGSVSASQAVTISNIGGVAISLGAVSITAPYRITANTCGTSLAPTYGCTVEIAFAPEISGAAAGTFSITDSVGTQIALLSGTGFSAATDSVTPLSLAFPEQVLATNSAPQLVTLTNSGDSALTLIRADIAGDFSVTNNCGASLAGHSSCAISVEFHPSVTGQSTGALTITDMLGSHVVALSGSGIAPAGISIAPTHLDFGGVGVGGSSSQTVTLTNNGGLPLEGLAFAINGSGYSISGNGCGTSLPSGANCKVQVAFSPAATESSSGNLLVTSSSATAFNLPLTGNGMDFQLVIVGLPSATVVTGQTAAFSLSVIPLGASNGDLTIGCEGAPKNSTCVVSPAAARMTAGNTIFLSVQVATGSASATAVRSGAPTFLPGLGVLLAAVLLPFGIRGRRLRGIAVFFLSAALAVSSLGCGVTVSGGKLAEPTNPPPVNATPPGSYTLTISAASMGIKRTTVLNLTVD